MSLSKERLAEIRARYNAWHVGYVEHWDEMGGRGYLRDSEGNRYPVEGFELGKGLGKKQPVKFQITHFCTGPEVRTVKRV